MKSLPAALVTSDQQPEPSVITANNDIIARRSERKVKSVSENRRQSAVKQMSSLLGKGLQGLQNSSSEEEDEGDDDDDASNDDSNEDKSDEEDYEGKWEFSAKGKQRISPSSEIRGRDKSREGRVGSFFKGHRGDHTDRDVYTQEQDLGELDDFIVGSDEEREEEEAAERVREKEKKARRKRREEKSRSKDTLTHTAKATPVKKNNSPATDSTGKVIKRIVIEDEEGSEEKEEGGSEEEEGSEEDEEGSEEEEEEGSEEEERNSRKRKRGNKRSTARRLASSSEDSSDDEEVADGPLLYWQVDALREESEEQSSALQLRQSFSPDEAMAAYIELLARAHLSADAISDIVAKPSAPAHSRLLSAARQFENKLCTMRESLLASGAWAGGGSEFASELQKRPFYITGPQADMLKDCSDERCAACNRTSKSGTPIHVYLYGCTYNAKEVWMSQRWVDLMPKTMFAYHDRNTSLKCTEGGNGTSNDDVMDSASENGSDSSTSDDDAEEIVHINPRTQWWARKWPGQLTSGRESRWTLSGHCKHRTQLYHSLLHYKFRLLLKIRERLEVHGYALHNLLNDQPFINHELQRYEALLEMATSQFGGRGMDSRMETGLNSLWKDGEGAGGSGSGRGVHRQSSDGVGFDPDGGGKHQSGMLNWLKKKDRLEE